MKDYADQIIIESRNDLNYKCKYMRKMKCPNRFPLGKKSDWADPRKYKEKANQKIRVCPSGEEGTVEMLVEEEGMWTTIVCPICGYYDFWAAGDGDDLF